MDIFEQEVRHKKELEKWKRPEKDEAFSESCTPDEECDIAADSTKMINEQKIEDEKETNNNKVVIDLYVAFGQSVYL